MGLGNRGVFRLMRPSRPCHKFGSGYAQWSGRIRSSFVGDDEVAIEGAMSMTTGSNLQLRLEAAAPALPDGAPAAAEPAVKTPPFVTLVQNAKTQAWDPHEVWLNRVKKPREQRSDR